MNKKKAVGSWQLAGKTRLLSADCRLPTVYSSFIPYRTARVQLERQRTNDKGHLKFSKFPKIKLKYQ